MTAYKAIDANGKDLKVGDWVKVIAAPIDLGDLPEETQAAFSRAIGEVLQIETFDQCGCIELDFHPKLGCFETIWLEPFLCTRFRRYKKLSKAFTKKQQLIAQALKEAKDTDHNDSEDLY